MSIYPTIHLTGGLGFIGSNLIRHLNGLGITPIVYDRLEGEKWRNVAGLDFVLKDWRAALEHNPHASGQVLIHLGADVDTTAPFSRELYENNVDWPLRLFSQFQYSRIVYASSAAVYGAEERDFCERVTGLKPLNAYAFTKLMLDRAMCDGAGRQHYCGAYGLRFFNVYGPNEGHKGEMASVVHKALQPIDRGDYQRAILTEFTQKSSSFVRTKPHWTLFKSHREGIADGEQKRDFVHVTDVCHVIAHFALLTGDDTHPLPLSGLYNVGTGVARSFNELVRAIDPTLEIEYRDMPANLRGQYQYHTCADLTRLRAAGYTREFMTLEEGVKRMAH